MSWTMDDYVAKYIELREKKKTLENRHKIELEEVKESMKLLEAVFSLHMAQFKQLNIKTAKGTAYRTETISITRTNMQAFIDFAYATDTDLLDIRPCKSGVQKFLENPEVKKAKIVIPGLQIDSILGIGVRKK